MIATILGSVLGFAGSAVGPIVDTIQAKQRAKLEITKMKQAAELAKQGYTHEQIMYSLKSRDDEHSRLLEHDIALTKVTGFIGGLQRLVRPLITYSFFGLFVFVEGSMVYVLLQDGADVIAISEHLWDAETQAIFATIITFWFGNRVFEKKSTKNHVQIK